jgi:GTP-binding protein Era
MEEENPNFRSGYVAVVGKPNVGKSTLVNALIGHKVAITSDKPQTTRRRILGILTRPDVQILFVDTPGIHAANQALNHYMMGEVDEALSDCDAILFVVDVSRAPNDDDRRVAERIAKLPQPKRLAMNKSDALDPRNVVANVAAYENLLPSLQGEGRGEGVAMLTSATRGDNLDKLLRMLVDVMPLGPQYFPDDQSTDQTARMLASEFIREQTLRHLEQEIPHGIAVAIDEWQPRENGVIYIGATIYVERESQKGILIGKGGDMLKKIGAGARKEIQREVNTKVFLELWVKVREGWRKDDVLVRRFLEGG